MRVNAWAGSSLDRIPGTDLWPVVGRRPRLAAKSPESRFAFRFIEFELNSSLSVSILPYFAVEFAKSSYRLI